jgi:hypothetical protein
MVEIRKNSLIADILIGFRRIIFKQSHNLFLKSYRLKNSDQKKAPIN